MRKYAWIVEILLTALPLLTLASSPDSALLVGHVTIKIWPHGAPGPKNARGPEENVSAPSDHLVAGRRVFALSDVSEPSITIFQPLSGEAPRPAIVVFPGGGYHALALDLEGVEVSKWLNSLGIVAVLLEYRVPEPSGVPRYLEPLEDAQRAVGYVRFHAAGWHIDPTRIGVIGFSAGGDLGALLSNDFRRRLYSPVDAADQESCRPDFAMLVYPAYLVNRIPGGYRLAAQLKVTGRTPPTFLVQAEDDPVHVENVVYYFLALKRAGVPAEMHIFTRGGHGYGLRRTALPVTRWPALAAKWLHTVGVLSPAAGNAKPAE